MALATHRCRAYFAVSVIRALRFIFTRFFCCWYTAVKSDSDVRGARATQWELLLQLCSGDSNAPTQL